MLLWKVIKGLLWLVYVYYTLRALLFFMIVLFSKFILKFNNKDHRADLFKTDNL